MNGSRNGLSIDVKELDEAMSSKISYRTIEDIKREEALKRLSSAEASDDDIVIEPVEEHKPVVDFIPVETPVDETSTQVEETVAPETETKENESVKETVAAETEPVNKRINLYRCRKSSHNRGSKAVDKPLHHQYSKIHYRLLQAGKGGKIQDFF